jgi:hypothetical protein
VTKFRVFLVGLMVASTTLLAAAPASAGAFCGLPKAACLAYYKVCQVGYDADLFHCVD